MSRSQGFLNLGRVVMLKKEKGKIVDGLAESLSKCTIVIATDYRGLTVKQMVQLRRNLRELGIEYKVAKNTLTRFAAERAGKDKLEIFLTGPLAMAFSYDDVIKPAKVLKEYIRSSGTALQIKGGMLGDRLLTAQELSELADMPPREVLLSMLVGQLRAPIQTLHSVLNAPMHGFLNVVQARIKQIEGGESV